jgi:hypothetical protein
MTMLTKQDILEQREQAQEDVLCILEEKPEHIKTSVCQVIVDRMNVLLAKLEAQ